MIPSLIACGSCAAGIQKIVFPPVVLWAWIACLWCVSVSVARVRYEMPSRLIPRPLGLVVVLVCLTATSAGIGPIAYLLLIPICGISAAHKIAAPSSAGSTSGRRVVMAILATAVVCLGVTAGVQYWRVSRMTSTQKVHRVIGTPGVGIEIARLARERADPIADYREILAAIDSASVAESIGHHLVCRPRDVGCASVLVDVLKALQGERDTAEVQEKLRTVLGLNLPADTRAKVWQEKVSEL